MIRWMLLSTLATGLFYGLYAMLLRHDRWLQLSRWYLIAIMVFSLAFPLIQLPEALVPSTPSGEPAFSLVLAVDGAEVTADAASPVFRLDEAIPAIYLFGLAVTLAVLLFQVVVQALAILKLRRRYSVYGKGDGFKIPRRAALMLPPDDTAPYSFFNQIVVGTRDLRDDELRCILEHESLHVRSLHSVDLIIVRALCCVSWFNPFAWLIASELRAVHEYQADGAVLAAHGREGYLGLLYREATGVGYGHITNNFQSINIKNRIAMMKNKKSRFGAWKVVAALPVAALLLMVGCKPAATEPVADEEVVATTNPTVEPVIFNNDSMPEGLVSPEFPGGVEALYKYIAENIQYPEQAEADGIEGRVIIRFVVMDNGDVVNVEVARGIGGGCDEEAVRVVKAMPKWTPATYEGKPVNVQYALPITFKLK